MTQSRDSSFIAALRRRYTRANHNRQPIADCPQPETAFRSIQYIERPSRRIGSSSTARMSS